jgi:flagellar basal body-associated protein FliL
MADEDEKQVEESSEESAPQEKPGGTRSMLPWILLATIVPVFAGTGFFLGRILGQGDDASAQEEAEEDKPAYEALLNPDADAVPTWIHTLAPFVNNLQDPGARRFVRVGFSLEMSGQLDPLKGDAYLISKNAHIMNRLGHYFGDRSVEELQGERNRRKILADVEDILNELLFKDVKPPIVSVLFGECAIQ